MISDAMLSNIMKNDSNTYVCPKCGRMLALDECEDKVVMVDFEGVLEETVAPACPDCHCEVVGKLLYAKMANIAELMSDTSYGENAEVYTVKAIVHGYQLGDVFDVEDYKGKDGELEDLLMEVRRYDGLANEIADEMYRDLYALWYVLHLPLRSRSILLDVAQQKGAPMYIHKR